MLGGIFLIILTGIFAFYWIGRLKKHHPFIDSSFLKKLFFYHLLLGLTYFAYVSFNPSDSKFYYQKILVNFRGESWFDFYGTSTTFIEFLGYPFVKFMGFSYEAMMALFSLFGFIGFLYMYVFFRENIRYKHKFLGVDLLTLVFLLPNIHFWSSSFGKGSVIFLGIGLFFYGISNIKNRFLTVFLGSIIIYHVRPHIMLVMLLSASIGFIFSSKNVAASWRLVFLAAAAIGFFFIYQDVLALVGFDDENVVSQSLDLTHRATELAKATSGVDITNYSLPMQLFTFLYRPLFIDAPGLLGIIVSVENVFYLLITLRILASWSGLKYLVTGNFLTKSALLSFLTVSIALAQISGNLGLAIRQKSQVIMLLLFVIMSYMDQEKHKQWKVSELKKRRRPKKTKTPPVAA